MAKHVFISHAGSDSPAALEIAKQLTDGGLEITIDREELRGGDSFLSFMEQALSACDFCLLLWSKAASQGKYVQVEWEAALYRTLEESRRFLVIARLEDYPLPALLGPRLRVELFPDRAPDVFLREALAIAHDVQRKAPDYPKSYVLAGHIHTLLKDYASAHEALSKAEALGTQNPWLLLNWAELLKALGNYEQAYERYVRGLRMSGTNIKALFSAIVGVERIADKVEADARPVDIPSLVFDTFANPSKRLLLANRLVDAYGGRRSLLNHAYQIAMRGVAPYHLHRAAREAGIRHCHSCRLSAAA